MELIPVSELCEFCCRFNLDELSDFLGFRVLRTSHCPLCGFLARHVPKSKDTSGLLGPQFRLKMYRPWSYLRYYEIGFCTEDELSGYGFYGEGRTEKLELQHRRRHVEAPFRLGTFDGDPAIKMAKEESYRRVLRTTPLLSTSASAESLSRAKSWLHDCQGSHKCGKSIPGIVRTIGPTRLIQLDFQSQLNGLHCIRVVEVHDKIPPYVALSYCWGKVKGENYKLTAASSKQLVSGLPLGQLPSTFQDVFSVVQTLGYSFVWIDALCIYQDEANLSDWVKESAKMNCIYGNAVFTIVSNTTAEPSQGLFNECSINFPQIPPEGKIQLQLTLPDGETGRLFLIKNNDGHLENMTNEEISKPFQLMPGPASGRGWTFQERVLSSRILHFNSSQITWECREIYETEDRFSHFTTKSFPQTTLAGILGKLGTAGPRDDDYGQLCWQLGLWYTHVVMPYTVRELTFSSDKLPALSGLSQCFAPYFANMTFVAGIWIPNGTMSARMLNILIHGLLWYRSPDKFLTRPRKPRFPSFSWAAVDGKVVYNREFFFNEQDARGDYSCVLSPNLSANMRATLHEVNESNNLGEDQEYQAELRRLIAERKVELEKTLDERELHYIFHKKLDPPGGPEEDHWLEKQMKIRCRFPDQPCHRFPIRLEEGSNVGSADCGYLCILKDMYIDLPMYQEVREEFGKLALELIGVVQRIKTVDPFGQVEWATLALRGFMQRGLVYEDTYALHNNKSRHVALRNKNHKHVGFVLLDFEDTSLEHICYFPLGSNDHVAFCLILRPLPSSLDAHAYERVGVAGIHEEDLDLTRGYELITLV